MWAGEFLGGEMIFEARDVPYRTQLVPLAAIHAALGASAQTIGKVEKIRRWYWCGVLGELYGGAIETRFANDLQQMVEWCEGGSNPPITVYDASFDPGRLLTLRTRNSAAVQGRLRATDEARVKRLALRPGPDHGEPPRPRA